VGTKDPCRLLKELLSEPTEREWLELKLNNVNPQEIGGYVSALANGAMLADREKAYLVFGVEDGTRKKVGTKIVLAKAKGKGAEGLANWLSRKLDPPLIIEYLDFECDGLPFAIMCVEPSYDRPVKFDGVAYVRVGEHKKKLADHIELERALWLATSRRKFEDAVAVTHKTADEVQELLDCLSYFKLTGEEAPTGQAETLRKLEKLGAVRKNMEGSYDILNLGAVLLASDVDSFPSIKGKAVRVIKYKGLVKGKSEPEQEGTKGYAVGFSGLVKYIMQRSTDEIIKEGVRRNVPLCPEEAVREVVANALIHQDFTNSGSGPVVEIYSNRIEVTNPGNSLIEPDRMIDERRSRNEKLAAAMRTLGLCEERGGGLDRTLIALENAHLPAPKFIPSKDSMRVVLFGFTPFKKMTKVDKQRACFFHCIIRWISHDYMSNASLRKRFDLPQEEYQAVSSVITAEVKANRIVPADPKQGKKNARYVPYWAR
jgi:ATP-dependent DNA helicase RecG